MNYCSECGAKVRVNMPPGDTKPQHVCTSCHTIHYQNPRVVAGCLVSSEDRVLLCRRAIEPRRGFWTFPAGFQELGESTSECAIRETLEETNANVEIDSMHCLICLIYLKSICSIELDWSRISQLDSKHQNFVCSMSSPSLGARSLSKQSPKPSRATSSIARMVCSPCMLKL